MSAPGQQWKHNWIPLTPAAALIKAKGSKTAAAKLRKRHGVKGRDTRSLVRTSRQTGLDTSPDRKDVERRARVELRMASDDQLADRLVSAGDDEKEIGKVIAELDRRDRLATAARERAEAKSAAKAAREAAQEADYDRRLADGEDPLEAYATAYGKDLERVRKDDAIASLRSAGHVGKGFDELVRNAFRDHVRQSWLDAEEATNGYLVKRSSVRLNIDPKSLFVGPESRARKHASDELLGYWQEHGRLTVEDFKASIMGGAMRVTGYWQ